MTTRARGTTNRRAGHLLCALALPAAFGLCGPLAAREVRPQRPIRPVRPIVAPDARWIHPSGRVALACDACVGGPSPDWLVVLGMAFDARGLDLVPVRVAEADAIATGGTPGFVALLRPAPAPRPAAACPAPAPEAAPEAAPDAAPVPASDAALPPAAVAPQMSVPPPPPPPPPPPDVHVTLPVRAKDVPATVLAVETALRPGPCAPVPTRYLFVTSDASDVDHILSAQATWVAHYAKLDADFVDVAELERLPSVAMERYAAVVLTASTLPGTGAARTARRLEDYVRGGGGLAALAGVPDDDLDGLFGVASSSAAAVPVATYTCRDAFLPGAGGLALSVGGDEPDPIVPVVPAKGTTVLCTGDPGGRAVPLILARPLGAGRTLLWNGGWVAYKSSRGLILLSLMEVSAPSAAAILDTLMFFVDDCPMPMWNEKIAPVDTLYGMTDAEYYRKIWWPGLSALIERHRLRPTFGFVLTYDDDTKGPFANDEPWAKDDPAVQLARDAAALPGEIGLHGYNHQSLAITPRDSTKGWPGRDAMEGALRKVREALPGIFGNKTVPRTYVAPDNLVQAIGKQAVLAVFPETTTIATQYLDEVDILGQEFGPDPDVPGVTDVPRVSSESALDATGAREVLDALALPGVFSHFIHPDDIFDPERSGGKTFEEMATSLEGVLARVDDAYPFLTRRTASEAAVAIGEFSHAKLEATRLGHVLSLRATDAPKAGLTVFVRTPPGAKVTAAGPCEVVHKVPADGRYYLRIRDGACQVTWQ